MAVVSQRLALSITLDKRFFAYENALKQIINQMLRLHLPNLEHYPLLLVNVWHTVIYFF